jgi:chromosome partitioning protein
MKTLAVYNIKGGVGKTAAAVNLSYLASEDNMQTLLMDLDPQGSTSYYFRVKPSKKLNTEKIFTKKSNALDKNIKGTDFEGLDLLPANLSFRNFDITLGGLKKSQKRLKKTIEPLKKQYDLIILDCPPNVTLLSENIFFAADHILVPLIPTTLSILSFEKLLDFFDDNGLDKTKLYPFFSMVERRKKMHKETIIESKIINLIKTHVPFNTDVERMGIYRQPACAFKPYSAGAKAFTSLWDEVKSIVFN